MGTYSIYSTSSYRTQYDSYVVWFVEIDENWITSILLHKMEIWKKVLLELECSRVISKRNWWTSLVMGSRNAIENQKGKNEIDSLEHTTKYVHQFLFEITLEHSSSNSTFFQISILCSRIEAIQFSSISTNHTTHDSQATIPS